MFIPYGWWHHVQATADLNVLVNFWWSGAAAGPKAAYAPLLHAVLGLRDLPARRKAIWRQVFEQYVFADSPAALNELGEEPGPLSRQAETELTAFLLRTLGDREPPRPDERRSADSAGEL